MKKGNLVAAAGVFAMSGVLAACFDKTHDPLLSYCTVDQESKKATIVDAVLNKPLVLMKHGALSGDGILTGRPVSAPESSYDLREADYFIADLPHQTCSIGNALYIIGYNIYSIKP